MKCYKIDRRTSKYNKYIKWFLYVYRNLESYNNNKPTLVSGYRTQNEARNFADRLKDNAKMEEIK